MSSAQQLRIAGVQPLTTVEWEGRLAAVAFMQGCPWRCRYCHNHHLIDPRAPADISWQELRDFLDQRQGLLDAVVFSGGEPTLQPALLPAARAVHELGFEVAVHTNGYSPEALARVLATGVVAYVAMDYKAPVDKYPSITGAPESGRAVADSLSVVLQSGVEYELRTTYHPELLSLDDVRTMAVDLREKGVQAYYLQQFRSEGCADEQLNTSALLPAELPAAFIQELSEMFPRFAFRPAH